MKAFLKNYRQSPRKMRLIADLVRGKRVERALAELQFVSKAAAEPIRKLILSAVANAKNNAGASMESLFIKDIAVDKGVVMKRFMPRARGSAAPIRKKSSHVMLTLESKTEVKQEAKQEKPQISKSEENNSKKTKKLAAKS
jgi:large subunit ribosomal protein L22